ncbi:MAG: DNA polymerase III subunit beta [Methylobacillus sp.]|jgi:DNA polymerase-3 subunit beta|nr:DNA polymerase III subunit beta [Methylobacillus sp.]
MNIKIDRDALLKPLSSVSGIVERRHTLPILTNLLLEAKQDTLMLTATDLEMQISLSTTAKPSADVATTVSASKLLDICRSLPEQSQITLEITDNRMQIKTGKSRFNLQTLPAADYPLMAKGSGDTSLTLSLPQSQLKRLLRQVQYAMAQQDIRYYLNGLLFEVNGNRLSVVGTDGHRLSYTSTELPQSHEKQELILPRKTVLELIKLLDDSDDEVIIEVSANQANFAFSGIRLISKVIDGKFPDYTRVIPTGYQNTFEVDRQSLHMAMQRASILSNEKYRGIRMVLGKDSLRLISSNSEQEEAEEEMEIAYGGDSLDIGFNVTYMIDVLTNVSTDSVIFSFNDANSSCLVTVPGDENYKYVVMPMRI